MYHCLKPIIWGRSQRHSSCGLFGEYAPFCLSSFPPASATPSHSFPLSPGFNQRAPLRPSARSLFTRSVHSWGIRWLVSFSRWVLASGIGWMRAEGTWESFFWGGVPIWAGAEREGKVTRRCKGRLSCRASTCPWRLSHWHTNAFLGHCFRRVIWCCRAYSSIILLYRSKAIQKSATNRIAIIEPIIDNLHQNPLQISILCIDYLDRMKEMSVL